MKGLYWLLLRFSSPVSPPIASVQVAVTELGYFVHFECRVVIETNC
jgi:hypothetical protein